MAGWIKLHRKILDNPIFLKPELYQLFSYCLLRANHSEKKIIWNGAEEIMEKGCFITGRKVIAQELKQNESSVYRHLKTLEKLNMISLKSNNKFSIVKVLNYCIYQGEDIEAEQQLNNKRTTTEQPANTDKNVRIKELKKDTSASILFEQFWKAYPKKKSKANAIKAWDKLKANEQLLQTILNAIERFKKTKDWQKDNGQYIPYPASWLNAKRWEDEPEQTDRPTSDGPTKAW